MKNEKIKDLDELAGILEDKRSGGKKIVHCHGVFDLLHIGHIRYFKQASQMGDVLIVTVTPDRYVDKGPDRPAFTETLRAEAVASMNCVDFVAVNKWATADETLRLLKPNIYVKGSEFENAAADITGKMAHEESVAKELGVKLAYTKDVVFSSSNLINKYLSNLPKEIDEYLRLFRKRYRLDELLNILNKMKSLNVLVIGDTILDEYQYCEAIGKSSKDPALALKYQSHELFAGGVLAVANHVANFANSVQLVTILGEQDDREGFVNSQLHTNVTPQYYFQPGAPTIVKRRFIDGYFFNKFFEVYEMDDSGMPPDKEDKICKWLIQVLSEFDLVIAADYGHGAISHRMRKILCENSRFLAVNTQANAENRGLHTLSIYPDADYASLAEHEFRMEIRNSNGNLSQGMKLLSNKMNTKKLVVTLGRKGCAVCDRTGGFVKVPAFAQNVVDRVGAGDAFLAVTSLAAVQDVTNELLGFVGNIIGALAVEIIGNKKAIDKLSVEKYITSLMK